MKVADTPAVERELRRLREELSLVREDLASFAELASHELQTPLRKIVAFGGLVAIRHARCFEDKDRADLERVRQAAERLGLLIGGLRELCSVATAPMLRTNVDLSRLAREVVRSLGPRLGGGRVDVGELPVVRGDSRLLRAMLEQLLDNAAKFRRRDRPCSARIAARRTGDRLELAFEDEGIGFEPRHASQLFRPFKRLHVDGDYPGIGVGLALCRRIASRHHGAIAARGASGRGAVFTVYLPLSAARPTRD